MGKTGKVIVFVIVCFVILMVLSIIKEAGGGAIMWLGALSIPLIYKSIFGKKQQSSNHNNDIALKKDKQHDNDNTLKKK
jgi:hypothetical protein